jgi:GNAT superfamily N-acetyltransferase
VTTIRRARPDDAWDVAVCQSTCWEQTYRGLVSDAYLDAVGPAERVDRWRDRIAGGRDVWLAALGEEVVGVASAGPSRDDPPVRTLELMTLYTLERVHGTGTGRLLLEAAIGTLPASLWVFEGNLRAMAFYAKHGFEWDGTTADDEDTGGRELRMVR